MILLSSLEKQNRCLLYVFYSLWDTKYHHELPSDYIIPAEYYDRYHLVFSHYDLDKKLGRIGLNENQRRKSGTITNSRRSDREMAYSWHIVEVSGKEDYLRQIPIIGSKVTQGEHLLN